MRHILSFVFAFCVIHSSLIAQTPTTSGSHWISPYADGATNEKTPCPLLRSTFTVAGPVKSGTVRIVGLGHYELYLNGRHVGNSLINQPWSQYNKTIYWQEFDISKLLKAGTNVWGVMLGNSFWHVTAANDTGRYVKTDAMPDFAAGFPFLLWLSAKIATSDGQEHMVTSDGSWKWHSGPLTFSHIYAGEDYDARLLPRGWNTSGFNDAGWSSVTTAPTPGAQLAPYSGPPMQAFEVFKPVRVVSPKPGEFTYVFPQNASALLRFTVSGPAGRTIRLKPCEYMDSTGHVKFTYTWGTRKDIWHDYTTAGGKSESHQILFCYVGCQYVGVTGAVPAGSPNPGNLPVIQKIEMVHVRTANPVVGSFTCSSDLQNRAEHMIDWSIRSNMSYVATDCPHREKNGWQEENWHMGRAMSYRFNVEQWFTKIARDLKDTQLPDGHVPTNCPNYLVALPPHGYWNEAPEWGISSVLVPWHLYEWYGTTEVLKTNFESMKKFVDYLSSTAKDGIINSNLGDWYDYGHGKGDGPSQWTPNELSGTAIWALGAKTVAQAAAVLGKQEEASQYQALFEQIRKDFLRHFYDPATKMFKNNGSCQAGHSAALCIGLVPEADRPAVLQAIVDDLAKRDYQQTVGEVLQVFFIRALADGNRSDVLHRVYSRTNRGSYGYMVNQGFTSLPESWDARPGTPNSMNHFMLGHLMEWHYAYLAGIRQQPGGIGWKKVLIAPTPGDIKSVSATFDAPTGMIGVDWNQANGMFSMSVKVPKNIDAIAVLPDGTEHILRAGTTTLRCAVR
ncbi:MAG TPA: family 78 glycoside hydrolase catalytic domain [Bacteroidota bacterium]|nr:family 78 glycoside hydrolase catalytic domain [Bacteroidota bacterium]